MLLSDLFAVLMVVLFSAASLSFLTAWIVMIRIAHREKKWLWVFALVFFHLFVFPFFLLTNWQVTKNRAVLYAVAVGSLLLLFPVNYARDRLIVDETAVQLQSDPQNPELHAVRGKALLSLDRDEEALDHFQEAWLRDSSKLEYADSVSLILEKQNKTEAVIDLLGRLHKLPAATPKAAAENLNCRLIRAYRKLGKDFEANEVTLWMTENRWICPRIENP